MHSSTYNTVNIKFLLDKEELAYEKEGWDQSKLKPIMLKFKILQFHNQYLCPETKMWEVYINRVLSYGYLGNQE